MPKDRTTWQTPPDIIVRLVDAYGPLALDPATAADNPTGAQNFFTELDDGLQWRWSSWILPNQLGFVNWPYSTKNNPVWAAKAEAQGSDTCRRGGTLATLVPVAPSTRWWRSMHPTEYHFLPKRLKHIDPDTGEAVGGCSFDSAVLVWSQIRANPFDVRVLR